MTIQCSEIYLQFLSLQRGDEKCCHCIRAHFRQCNL